MLRKSIGEVWFAGLSHFGKFKDSAPQGFYTYASMFKGVRIQAGEYLAMGKRVHIGHYYKAADVW